MFFSKSSLALAFNELLKSMYGLSQVDCSNSSMRWIFIDLIPFTKARFRTR